MNHRSNHSSIDWQQLDRLVDGRLDEDAYRELLCQIDMDPDGWKQCALAFLENQALEKELGGFADDPGFQLLPGFGPAMDDGEQPVEATVSPASQGRSSTINSVIGWMSMSLCIVGGLALGFTLNSEFRDQLVPNDLMPTGQMINAVANNEPVTPNALSAQTVNASSDGAGSDGDCCPHESRCSQRNRYSLANKNRRVRDIDPNTGIRCSILEDLDDLE